MQRPTTILARTTLLHRLCDARANIKLEVAGRTHPVDANICIGSRDVSVVLAKLTFDVDLGDKFLPAGTEITLKKKCFQWSCETFSHTWTLQF